MLLQSKPKSFLLLSLSFALLLLTFIITFLSFLIHHLRTRPYHNIPIQFHHESTSTHSFLYANHTFLHSQLQQFAPVKKLQLELILVMPESNNNYENSVFDLSTNLYCQSKSISLKQQPQLLNCVHHQLQSVSLQFRSLAHRVFRSLLLSPWILIGLIKEYQTLSLNLLSYYPSIKETIHSVQIRILNPSVQISSAYLILKVVRKNFLFQLISVPKVSSFLVTWMTSWYVSLLIMFCMFRFINIIIRIITGTMSQMTYSHINDEDTQVETINKNDHVKNHFDDENEETKSKQSHNYTSNNHLTETTETTETTDTTQSLDLTNNGLRRRKTLL